MFHSPLRERLPRDDYKATLADRELSAVFACFPLIPYLTDPQSLEAISPCDRSPMSAFLRRAGFWPPLSPPKGPPCPAGPSPS